MPAPGCITRSPRIGCLAVLSKRRELVPMYVHPRISSWAYDQAANCFQPMELQRPSFMPTPGWSASSSFRENESLLYTFHHQTLPLATLNTMSCCIRVSSGNEVIHVLKYQIKTKESSGALGRKRWRPVRSEHTAWPSNLPNPIRRTFSFGCLSDLISAPFTLARHGLH